TSPKPRRRTRAVLVAATLVLAVGAGAGTAVWLLGKDGKSDDEARKKDDGKKASQQADPPKESPTAGGDAVADPSEDPSAPPADATYTLVFENKPMTLRTPAGSLDTTYIDLDTPKVDPTGSMDSEEADFHAGYQELSFDHAMGKASGTTAKQCREGAEQNPFRESLSGEAINKAQQIVKGDHLCMVTGEGNVAMWTITAVEPPNDKDYLPDLKGTVTLWESSA
ncbi:serine/threonine protein kinase, partial [Streptomyces arenae]|nr:serine/threonine protein kinase [Streptomyces arenae]